MKDFSNRFRSLVEGVLPKDSRVLTPEDDAALVLLATWRLPREALRPAKRSRMIRIAISQEALEDYESGSDGFRLASDRRFIKWLERRLESFDPNHDAPLGVEPPQVTWALDTRDLNGDAM